MRDSLNVRYGSLKVAAYELQIATESLSRLLNPQTPNPITRLADLGPEWEREWLLRRAPKCGLTVLDERTAALLQMVDQHRRQMVRFEEAV